MEITYQRNLHRSYMCIEEKEDAARKHELMMLQRYKIPQLLPVQIMEQDGKRQYWFEITGKQQLKDYLGGRPIEIKHIKKFLFSLEQVCRKMPEFLLREERVCLQEELLYVDLTDETIYFTYLPFRQGDFPEELKKMMEETLKKIDHQNRRCAELAYDLYEKICRENISIRELLNAKEWDMEEEKMPKQQTEERRIREKDSEERSSWQESVHVLTPEKEEPDARETISHKIKGIWQEQKEAAEDKLLGKLEKYKSIIPKRTAADGEHFRKKRKPAKEQSPGSRNTQESKLFQKERTKHTEAEIPVTAGFTAGRQNIVEKNPTETLELYPGRPEGRLIYQGAKECRDFRIEKEEFLIGRSMQQADGRIDADEVSRMHAKIIRREGEFYIEDLNSTNGTYLNGELLEYHKDRKLKRNDRIRFGMEEYVFC